MERLTTRNDIGNAVLKQPYRCESCGEETWSLSDHGDRDPIDKLAEYEDLEEHGKLLKPRCIPGDYVWEVNKKRNIISEYEIISIRYGINKTFHYMWALRHGIYSDLDGFFDKDIDNTVFMSEEEAEAAL